MVNEFILKKTRNKIIIRIGEIEVQSGDALINWASINLNSGPDSFYRIHRQAGAQLASAVNVLQPYVKSGDVVSTIAGMLDFYIVLHGILPLPEETQLYEMLMFNAINVLATYKEKNICRNLYFTFPDTNNNNKTRLLRGLLDYENKLEDFTFVIMVSEKDFKETAYLVEKTINVPWWKKLFTKLKKKNP